MIILILILILIYLCILKIEIKILNIIDDTSVCIKIGLITINIDYDLFIKNLNKITVEKGFKLNNLKESFGYYNIAKNIVNHSNVNINKMIIVKKNNNYNILNIYVNTTFYTIGTIIKNFLLVNTKKQNNITFLVLPSNENDIDIDIDFNFSLILFLKSCILNIKNMIKIKKDMI